MEALGHKCLADFLKTGKATTTYSYLGIRKGVLSNFPKRQERTQCFNSFSCYLHTHGDIPKLIHIQERSTGKQNYKRAV